MSESLQRRRLILNANVKRPGPIQAALNETLRKELAPQRLLPHLLAKAAQRIEVQASKHELEQVACAIVASQDGRMELDFDLPCSLGATTESVQSTIQALVSEVSRVLPQVESQLSDAVGVMLPETLKAMAAAGAEQFTRDAQEHASRLAESRAARMRAVEGLWGSALYDLDLMRHLVLEWWVAAADLGSGPFAQSQTTSALRFLAERCFDIGGEVLVLARHGYADGALARWRSLHEVCVVAMYLAQRDDRCSTMYLSHHKVEEFRLLEARGTGFRRDRYAHELRAKQAALVAKYGDPFAGDYGWAAVDMRRKKVTFKELEAAVGLERLRLGYKHANHAVHAGALATLTRISAGVGASTALPPEVGCGAAAEYCVASLAMLVADLCLTTESADLLAMNMIIQQQAATVRARIARTHARFSETSPRNRSQVPKRRQTMKPLKIRPTFRR